MGAIEPEVDAIAFTLDGDAVDARPGELLIDAAERHGVYIPRFCYHPRMKPVGMCRMCLVEVDSGRGAALTPACMIDCTPDMAVVTDSPVVIKAQDGVLEFLLINHPLDCPVCDKGGECPLQDQVMAYGPGESRFIEEKRHFEKPIEISPTVYLDRERCILCDRCTRFASDVAGDPLIHFQDRGNQTQVNTFPDDPFVSYFSGNTVQICPVGALTAKPYRFKARPWDLDEVASTCVTSPTGDGIVVQASRNRVLRYLGRDVDAVNWGWLSDKDRFGFEAVSHEHRVTEPLVRGDRLGNPDANGSDLVQTRWSVALAKAAELIDRGRTATGSDSVAVIGGARLTNESQYAWAKLAKAVVGTDNVDAQLGDGLSAETVFSLPRATIAEACAPGGVLLLLGPDPKEGFGSLALRLRHAIVEDGVELIELTPRSTGLGHLARASLICEPGGEREVAAALVSGGREPVAGVSAVDLAVAADLLGGSKPLTIFAGRSSLAQSETATIGALRALLSRSAPTRVLSGLRRANVHGALDMGLAPGWLPGRRPLGEPGVLASRWGSLPDATGLDTAGALAAAADGRLDTLVLLGSDPLADFPDRELAEQALDGAGSVVAVDQFLTESSRRADVVLPAAFPTEMDGSFTNLEGRVSAVNAKVTPAGTAWTDWMIANELARRLGHELGCDSPEAIWAELDAVSDLHRGLDLEAIRREPEGLVVGSDPRPFVDREDADQPPSRDQWTHRLVATHRLYDNGTLLQHCPASAGLAPGALVGLAPADFDALGLSDGAQVRISSHRASITVPAFSDSALARGSAGLWVNQPDGEPNRLVDSSEPVTDVKVETIG